DINQASIACGSRNFPEEAGHSHRRFCPADGYDLLAFQSPVSPEIAMRLQENKKPRCRPVRFFHTAAGAPVLANLHNAACPPAGNRRQAAYFPLSRKEFGTPE